MPFAPTSWSKAGDSHEAAKYYRAAAGKAVNFPERNYLLMPSRAALPEAPAVLPPVLCALAQRHCRTRGCQLNVGRWKEPAARCPPGATRQNSEGALCVLTGTFCRPSLSLPSEYLKHCVLLQLVRIAIEAADAFGQFRAAMASSLCIQRETLLIQMQALFLF